MTRTTRTTTSRTTRISRKKTALIAGIAAAVLLPAGIAIATSASADHTEAGAVLTGGGAYTSELVIVMDDDDKIINLGPHGLMGK